MRKDRLLAALAAGMAFLTVSANAQNPKPITKRPPTPKVVTSSTLPGSTAAEVQSGAQKVSIQIKNVTKFIYALGGIASGIENIDKDTRANRSARDVNEVNKREVIQAIRNLRAGLAALEVEFRTKANLKKYLQHIDGITSLSAESEEDAAAGRFSSAGKPLLLVVEKLSDTLAAMP
ncbi:MAG: hypothetical protein ACT4O9_09575 [Blastocatellia bacterium]